jgi:hypothetical protein
VRSLPLLFVSAPSVLVLILSERAWTSPTGGNGTKPSARLSIGLGDRVSTQIYQYKADMRIAN